MQLSKTDIYDNEHLCTSQFLQDHFKHTTKKAWEKCDIKKEFKYPMQKTLAKIRVYRGSAASQTLFKCSLSLSLWQFRCRWWWPTPSSHRCVGECRGDMTLHIIAAPDDDQKIITHKLPAIRSIVIDGDKKEITRQLVKKWDKTLSQVIMVADN